MHSRTWIILLLVMPLAGCFSGPAPEADWLATGIVLDAAHRPVVNIPVASNVGTALTNELGEFQVAARGDWSWLETGGAVRPAFPDFPVTLRATQADSTMLFTGDVMFARQFYTRGWPEPNLAAGDVGDTLRAGLTPLAPYLEHANATVVNLETVLGRNLERHPQKEYTFLSDPAAAAALVAVGVDAATLGNNHIVDGLARGVEQTITLAEAAGLGVVGAGENRDAAWEPLQVLPGVWLHSCVHQRGQPFFDHPATTVKPGAAYCGDLRARATLREGLNILSAHSDAEYQVEAAPWTRALAQDAADLGFGLFLAHGSHVGGGLELVNGMPTAWGLGNFIFDSLVWPTAFSVVAGVDINDGRVDRLWLEPMVRDPLVAEPMHPHVSKDWLVRLAAASGPVVFDEGILELDISGDSVWQNRTISIAPGVHAVHGQVTGPRQGFNLAPVWPPATQLMALPSTVGGWLLDGSGGPSNPLRPAGDLTIHLNGTGRVSVHWSGSGNEATESGDLPLTMDIPHADVVWIHLAGQARISSLLALDHGVASDWASHVVADAPANLSIATRGWATDVAAG